MARRRRVPPVTFAAAAGTSARTAGETSRLRAGLPGGLKGLFLVLLPAIWLLTPMGVGYADHRLVFAIPVATFVVGFIAGMIFTKRKTS
jgi:hypothetical protein